MLTQQDDSSLEVLDDKLLRVRLSCRDWENDPQFVPDEQVLRLFRHAEEVGDSTRVGLLSRELGRRLLGHAKGFAYRSGIYLSFGSLDQAAEELSQYVWECLIKRIGDAAHAERYFGQLFKRRALDFQRRLLAKKRNCQDSLDAMTHTATNDADEEDRDLTPLEALERKQLHAQAAVRLQEILTKEEHMTFVMLFVDDMKVQGVATALDVTVRTINNYKNAALKKIQKEFKT